MRILKIVNSIDGGGIFACEKQFIEELNARNIIVDLVILGEGDSLGEYEKIVGKSFKIPGLDATYGGAVIKILSSIVETYHFGSKYSKILEHKIKASAGRQYDAIIYQRPVYIHLAGKLGEKLKTKVLWHLPSVARTIFSKNYYNLFCKKYNIVQVANSHYTKSTLGEQCEHIVYPGFDPKRIKSVAPVFKQKLGIDITAPVYGVAARMHEYKAQDIVVKAFVQSEIPAKGGHLLIAGGPLDSDFAHKVVQEAGDLLNKQIHFLGDIKDVSGFYASVDIIINGRLNAEPFGISVAEAIGAGKPVVAYKLGGPSEMIVTGASGWLIDDPSVESYKAALNLSIQNKDKWVEMGKIAKESSSKFTVEENVSTLIDIINDARS